MSGPRILRASRVEARFEPWDWPWARREADRIAAHWERRLAEQPRMFDGRILLMRDMGLEGGVFRATYFEASFAALLAFKEFGFPDPDVANGFAMGALRAADGAFLLGVMGPHTANRGRIYFAAGTPDPSDVTADGRVDLAGSVLRELAEETGLQAHEVEAAESWIIVRDGGTCAFLRPLALPENAAPARERLLAKIRAQADPELADIAIARGPADIDPERMPRFIQAYLADAFAARR